MLSFNKGKSGIPIARVDGGEKDEKILYIHEEKQKEQNDDDFNVLDLITEDMFYDKIKRRQMKSIDMNKVIKAIKMNQEIQDENLESPFKRIKGIVDKKNGSEIILHSGQFQFIPNPKVSDSNRHVILISGASGSGKSYWCADYASEYIKLFPKHKVYIFSKKDKDPPFDKQKKIIRFVLDETFIDDDEPLSHKDFANSLCIFDDVDTIEGEIGRAVMALRSDLLQCGRACNTSVCITTHITCNGSKTKEMINEATHYVFFRGANKLNVGRLLKVYIGIPDDKASKIFNLPSRWMLVSKNYPAYIMYSSGCYLVD